MALSLASHMHIRTFIYRNYDNIHQVAVMPVTVFHPACMHMHKVSWPFKPMVDFTLIIRMVGGVQML